MAEVTKGLMVDILAACKTLGWENDTAQMNVSVQFHEKRSMSITYQAIADLMELHSLATPEEAMKWSLQESQIVPAVGAAEVEALPVVTDASKVEVGQKFLPSEDEKLSAEVAKAGECIWVCAKCCDGTVKRVPVVVAEESKDAKA